MNENLPDHLKLPGGGTLTIEQRNGLDQNDWCFVEQNGTVLVINAEIPLVAKHAAVMREILVIARNLLGPGESLVDSAPVIILYLMTQVGLYEGLSKNLVEAYVREAVDAG